MIEPAQGSPRAIRVKPPTKYGRVPNHVANPSGNKAAKIREAVTHENKRANHADQAANPPRNQALETREAVPVRGQLVLAREHWWRSVSMSGFARRRVSNIRGSGEHRAFGAPMNRNCTLWTLRVAWLKAFSLLRFFVALDKEMTCRHAQWLTVIKKTSNTRRPLRPKAATRH